MATARSSAIIKSRQSDYKGERHSSHDDDETIDIAHYAMIGRVLGPAIESMPTRPNRSLPHYQEARSATAQLRAHLSHAVLSTYIQNDEHLLAEHLRISQLRRGSQRDIARRVEDSFMGGVGTAVIATAGLHSLIESGYNRDVADHPKSADLLYEIAKLHISQLHAYTTTYIPAGETYNHAQWASQVELSPNKSHAVFRRGYPLSAVVPRVVTRRSNYLSIDDVTLAADTDTVCIGDMQTDRETIGCPVTFSRQHTTKIWQLYCNILAEPRQA